MADDFFDDAAASTKAAQEASAGERLPTWKFTDPGDLKLVFQEAVIQPLKDGTFTFRLSILNTEDNEQYTLWMGADGDSPKLLTSAWWTAAPALGSKVLISYAGKKRSPESGYEYGLFQVRAEVEDMEYWADLGHKRALKIKMATDAAMQQAGTQSGGTSIQDLPDAF